MDNKFIFDATRKYFGNIFNAAKEAILKGYNFMIFNDIVYFIDELGNCHSTKIYSKDLY